MCSCVAVRFSIGNTYRNLCDFQQPEELRWKQIWNSRAICNFCRIAYSFPDDWKVIIKAIVVGDRCGRSLVVKICCLLEMEREVVVHHSYGKANQCVDALANLVSLLSNAIVYYEFVRLRLVIW
jgi:hypothetical protein